MDGASVLLPLVFPSSDPWTVVHTHLPAVQPKSCLHLGELSGLTAMQRSRFVRKTWKIWGMRACDLPSPWYSLHSYLGVVISGFFKELLKCSLITWEPQAVPWWRLGSNCFSFRFI